MRVDATEKRRSGWAANNPNLQTFLFFQYNLFIHYSFQQRDITLTVSCEDSQLKSSVLGFWRCLPWISKPGWILWLAHSMWQESRTARMIYFRETLNDTLPTEPSKCKILRNLQFWYVPMVSVKVGNLNLGVGGNDRLFSHPPSNFYDKLSFKYNLWWIISIEILNMIS